jgi:ribosome-associated translation inhibitor RaiA
MKTSLRYLGLNAQAAWDRLVHDHLSHLQRLTSIESAQVLLERQRENKPPFRARVVLVVPGPDYHAEAADHTLAAALRKAVQNLKRQIQARQTKRRVNGKSNLQLGNISSHWSSALAADRA